MSFFESSVPRTERRGHHSTSDEQVPYWLSDARLERRELARERAERRRKCSNK